MADSSYGAMVVRDAQMGDVNGNGESMALSLGANMTVTGSYSR